MYICTILQCITDCEEGEVRLVGGETESEGTIEVCLNSVWGLITDAGRLGILINYSTYDSYQPQ